MVGKPNDTVYKIASMPRWQREWINKHRSINYSGLVQMMLDQIIEKNDPEYFRKHKVMFTKISRRSESTKQFCPNI